MKRDMGFFCDGILPVTVQYLIMVSAHLGSGMFFPDMIRIQLFAPGGIKWVDTVFLMGFADILKGVLYSHGVSFL